MYWREASARCWGATCTVLKNMAFIHTILGINERFQVEQLCERSLSYTHREWIRKVGEQDSGNQLPLIATIPQKIIWEKLCQRWWPFFFSEILDGWWRHKSRRSLTFQRCNGNELNEFLWKSVLLRITVSLITGKCIIFTGHSVKILITINLYLYSIAYIHLMNFTGCQLFQKD